MPWRSRSWTPHARPAGPASRSARRRRTCRPAPRRKAARGRSTAARCRTRPSRRLYATPGRRRCRSLRSRELRADPRARPVPAAVRRPHDHDAAADVVVRRRDRDLRVAHVVGDRGLVLGHRRVAVVVHLDVRLVVVLVAVGRGRGGGGGRLSRRCGVRRSVLVLGGVDRAHAVRDAARVARDMGDPQRRCLTEGVVGVDDPRPVAFVAITPTSTARTAATGMSLLIETSLVRTGRGAPGKPRRRVAGAPRPQRVFDPNTHADWRELLRTASISAARDTTRTSPSACRPLAPWLGSAQPCGPPSSAAG